MVDVARRANVTQMTVSRALRAPERLSEATLRQVMAAIRETGYVSNNIASSLATNQSKIVAVIIPSITHSSLEPMIESVMSEVKKHGLYLMIGTSGETVADEAAMITAILGQRPCGLILHNTKHSRAALAALKNARIPVVECGDLTRKPVDMCVSFGNREAARAMTAHLLSRGYRRIAFASVLTKTNYRSRERVAGHLAALEEAGLPVADELLRESGYGFDGGVEMMRKLIEEKVDVDAVFCGTGILALGALHECRRQGWSVPGRVAIAGFGHNEITDAAIPSLTSIKIPRAEIGQRAAQLLLDRIAGADIPSPVVDLGFEIVARSST
jgi:LacI family transcriptional regulator, gluconate utilization system Gnt-I transcriptional repressor